MCVHTIVEHPFCNSPSIYVTIDEMMWREAQEIGRCRKYSFIPCAKYEATGELCVQLHKDEAQYREDILARNDTIVRIELTDCNMKRTRNGKWHSCKAGLGRRATDQFSNPVVIEGDLNVGPERKISPGTDGEELKAVILRGQRGWKVLPSN